MIACTRGDPGAADRDELKRALASDVALDRALKSADDAERAGHDDQAADILKRTALPAADESMAAADGVSTRTPWGRKEKDTLVTFARDRKDELGKYEHALRGTDLDEKLAAIEKQLELEKRAQTIAQEIDRGP